MDRQILLFKESPIAILFEYVRTQAKVKASHLNLNQVESIGITQVSNQLAENLSINLITVDFDARSVNISMSHIKGSRFPFQYDVDRSRLYPCARVNYKYPITSGNSTNLSYTPTVNFISDNLITEIGSNQLILAYQTLSFTESIADRDKTLIKHWIKETEPKVQKTLKQLNTDIVNFNKSLPPYIGEVLSNLLQQKELKTKDLLDLNSF